MRELHSLAWFCRPLPELFGQRDMKVKTETSESSFRRRPFERIRRILPDTASRRFHATRPKPQSRKPAWLPFYTGGDSSLPSDLSAFIFRLPCGQQREQPHRANPTDLRRPCGTTDALIAPKRPGIKPFSVATADAALRSDAGIAPTTFDFRNRRSTD